MAESLVQLSLVWFREEWRQAAALVNYADQPSLEGRARWLKRYARRTMWRGSHSLAVKKQVGRSHLKHSRAVVSRFVSLMGNASLYDWAWIMQYNSKCKLLGRFDLGTKSILPADGIQWPITWYLTRYSRSFIFLSKSLPNRSRFLDALQQFEAKIAWRWIFRNREAEVPVFPRLKSAKTSWPPEGC